MADLIHDVHGEINFSYDGRGVLQARNSLGELVAISDLTDTRMNRMGIALRRVGGVFVRLGIGVRSLATRSIPSLSTAFTALRTRIGSLVSSSPRLVAAFARIRGAWGSVMRFFGRARPVFTALLAGGRAVGRGISAVFRGIGGLVGTAFRGIASAASSFGRVLGSIGGAIGSVLSAIPAPVFLIGAALTALPALFAGASSAAASLGTAASAGASLLPGALLAVAGAVLVAKIAFGGLGDVAKAAFETDPKKFNEAIKGLPPNVQAVALAFRKDMVPTLKTVRDSIRQVTFTNVAKDLPGVNAQIAGLKVPLDGVAAALNHVVRQFLQFAATKQAGLALSASLILAKNVLHGIGDAIKPVLTGLSTLAMQGAVTANSMVGNIGAAGERLGKFLGNVDVGAMVDSVKNGVAPVAEVFSNLGTVVSNVFGALSNAGAGAFGTIGIVLEKVAAFTESEAGAAALDAVAQAVAALGGVLGDVLMAALVAVGPALVALSPLVQQLGGLLGAVLVPVIQLLAPILTFVAQLLGAVLTPLIGPLTDAFQTLMVPLQQLVSALLPALTPLLEVLGTLVAAVAPILGVLANIIAGVLVVAINLLMPVLTFVVDILTALVTTIADVIKWVVDLAARFVTLENVKAVVQGIVDFIAGVFEWLYDFLVGHSVIPDLINAIMAWWDTLVAATTAVFNAIAAFLSAVWEGIKTAVMTVVNFLVSLIMASVNGWIAIFQRLGQLPGQVAAWFGGIASAVRDKVSQVLDVVRDLPVKIFGFFSDIGGRMAEIGRNIVQGIINGISGMFGRVKDKVADLINMIPEGARELLGISSPSKVMIQYGMWTGEGLAIGLRRTAELVSRATEGLVGEVVVSGRAPALSLAGGGAGLGGGGASTTTNNVDRGVTMNVYGLPGQSAGEVGDGAARRINFALTTGVI